MTYQPVVLSAGTLKGDKVRNPQGDELGAIEEIMIDLDHGRVAYAVLSFGGLFGIGDKLFAIPWESLRLDADNKCFILNVTEEQLEGAPGFDKDNWPSTPDRQWLKDVYTFYDRAPYW